MKYINIKNNRTIPLKDIPILEYPDFLESNTGLMNNEDCHCVNYFGYQESDKIKLICCIANDNDHSIYISSSIVNRESNLQSFSAENLAFHCFEREIHENFGIQYSDHLWLKPVRFPHNRADLNSTIATYPFYEMDSDELHKVGVGPIHAGVIEPGHFRFICNGEQIIHLEIQLGFQHRGIETLFLQKKKLLQRTTLAENIAGDTVAGHTTAFVNLWESLCKYQPPDELQFSRTLANELERIAVHTGDLSAICTDIAYQLGSSVFGRLRTPIINFIQLWCGNRLSKGLIRAGKNNFPFTQELADTLSQILDQYETGYKEMWDEFHVSPSCLSRLEKTGLVKKEQAKEIGTVGMSARMCGINRDIRQSHPYNLYSQFEHQPIIKRHGDVYSRTQIRNEEIIQSLSYIRRLIKNIPDHNNDQAVLNPSPNSFTISLIEGWRGEICHCAITDINGDLVCYKIKDPSFNNWLALALAVRNNEISDFPVCNKSFNLSYCGNDL